MRGSLTTAINALVPLLAAKPIDPKAVRIAVDLVREKRQRLEPLDAEIIQLLSEKDYDSEEALNQALTDEHAAAEEYRDKASKAIGEAQHQLDLLKTPQSRPASPPPPSPGGALSHPAANNPASAFKVPDYKLATFTGKDLLEFPSWFDSFKSLIDAHPCLSKVQKFGILKESVGGTAKQLISALLTTEENYSQALQLLEETFGDPNLLLGLFVSKLHSYSPVKDPRSPALQELVFGFERSFLEIKNLIGKLSARKLASQAPRASSAPDNVPPIDACFEVVSFFLTPHLLSKLPEDVQMRWFDKFPEPQQRYDFDKLLGYLKNELKGRQACMLLSDRDARKANPSKPKPRQESCPTDNFVAASQDSRKCMVCNGPQHALWQCAPYMAMPIAERDALVKRLNLCYNCLATSHWTRNCPSKKACFHCQARHNSTLCPRKYGRGGVNSSAPQAQAEPPTQATVAMVASSETAPAVLQVVAVKASNPSKRGKTTYALFDSGAAHTWIRADLAHYLGLKVLAAKQFEVNTFGGSREKIPSALVTLRLASPSDPAISVSVFAWTAEQLTRRLTQRAVIPPQAAHLDPFEAYDGRPLDIGIIIGGDNYYSLLAHEYVHGSPTAVRTIFGWTLLGSSASSTTPQSPSTVTSLFVRPTSIEDLWNLETVGICEDPNALADPYLEPKLVGDRYEVRLPFRSDARPISNYEIASRRLASMERKMSPAQKAEYDKNLTTALQNGYIELAPNPSPHKGFFLPHHGVKSKGKLRVVFDGSCADPLGVSLNATLDPGPNLLALILDIIVRFRLRAHPLVADITGAFHQLLLHPDDRCWVQFLWNGQIWRFSRVVFGLSCSPFLLLRTLYHHYSTLPEDLGRFLLESTYMDDIINSLDDPCERDDLLRRAQEALAHVGMTLRVPDSSSVLGLPWDRETDGLAVDLSSVALPPQFTRRELLKSLASVFDPCGLISPYTVRARMLLQDAWRAGGSWDDPLPPALCEAWREWVADCSPFQVPRWLGYHSEDTLILHVFSDASKLAYATVLYLACPEKRTSILFLSKARVAPLRTPLTVPRAELMGLTLGARLASHAVKSRLVQPTRVIFWSDSQTVLSWLSSGPPRGLVFVRNRLQEIRSLTSTLPNCEFRYVVTHQNPADIPSRGARVSDLTSLLWLHGPEFIRYPDPAWPEIQVVLSAAPAPEEEPPPAPPTEAIPLDRFSSLPSLLGTAAWVLRFVHNLKARHARRVAAGPHVDQRGGPLTPAELTAALHLCVQKAQQTSYPVEWNQLSQGRPISRTSALLNLHPRWDPEARLIVACPRTGEPPLLLLPSRGRLTELVVLHHHEFAAHPGGHGTLSEVRRTFWLPHGLSTVKRFLPTCRPCRRFKASPPVLPEGPLASFRAQPAPPFSIVGADHWGPLTLKDGKKVWILLLTCAVTRGIHLEVCRNLSAAETYLRLRAFLALRVPPRQTVRVFSDNSTTFVRVSQMPFPHHNVEWKRIPERAPTFGGWWERLVRTSKDAMRVTFHGKSLPLRELPTLLHELAALINRRPLTLCSTDPRDAEPLTPAHFLYGCPPVGLVPPEGVLELPAFSALRSRLSEDFWRRWLKVYLAGLRGWTARRLHDVPFSVGDVVLVKEPSPRGRWPLGRILELIPGRDGVARAAHVLIRGRRTRRLLSQLVFLEAAEPREPALPRDPPAVAPLRTRSGRVVRAPQRTEM